MFRDDPVRRRRDDGDLGHGSKTHICLDTDLHGFTRMIREDPWKSVSFIAFVKRGTLEIGDTARGSAFVGLRSSSVGAS